MTRKRLAAWRRPALLLVAALLLVHALPAWPAETTAAEILRSPERFDGKTVTVTGRITNLQTRVSRRGNAYYTFDLANGGVAIRVFSFGQSPCPAGAEALVEGRFERIKHVGRYTFRNEVDATAVKCR